MINNQQGLILISFIFLLPLMLLILFSAISISADMSTKLRLSYACYTNSLKAQKIISTEIKKLTDLNPKARALRLKRKITQAKLAASIAAQAYGLTATLKAELKSITLQQLALSAVQQSIITSARIKSKSQFIKAVLTLKKEAFILKNKSPGFSLKVKHAHTKSPEYFPSQNFSRVSTSHIYAKLKKQNKAILFANKISGVRSKSLTISCSARNIKKEKHWIYHLKKAS